MTTLPPIIGDWYLSTEGTLFEVIAIDHRDGDIEIEHFDGVIETLGQQDWDSLELKPSEAPHEWLNLGSLNRDGYQLDVNDVTIPTWVDPLVFLDQQRL